MQQNGKEASMRQNVFQIHSEKLFVREWGTSTELSTLWQRESSTSVFRDMLHTLVSTFMKRNTSPSRIMPANIQYVKTLHKKHLNAVEEQRVLSVMDLTSTVPELKLIWTFMGHSVTENANHSSYR